jgi:hypothetical protein
MKFKTLIDENDWFIVVCTEFPEPMFGTVTVPQLYPMTSTLEAMVEYFPKLDFSEISMVEVEINLVD